MTPLVLAAGLASAVAVALAVPAAARLPVPVGPPGRRTGPVPPAGETARSRLTSAALAATLCGAGAWLLVGGSLGAGAALMAAAGSGWVVLRAEPGDVRRRREEVARDLPALVDLLAATLRAGAGPAQGLVTACDALPGAAAERLIPVRGRLALGVPAVEVWSALATDPELGVLGRALARAEATGAPVVPTVARVADELEQRRLAAAEDRARGVGVRAAVPLGLCLLPAFLLLGIVPTVAGLLGSLLP